MVGIDHFQAGLRLDRKRNTLTMLDLTVSDEEAAIVDLADALATDLRADLAGVEPKRGLSEGWKRVLETGMGAPVSEINGGDGVPPLACRLAFIEHLAHGHVGVAAQCALVSAASVLASCMSTSEQWQRARRPEAEGADTSEVLALYEGHGRAPSEYRTTLKPRSDGSSRLVGRKLALGCSDSIGLVVIAREETTGRLRAVRVPSRHAARVRRSSSQMLGLDGMVQVKYDFDTVVGVHDILGDPADDSKELARLVSGARLHIAALALGYAFRAIEYAGNYATERVAFGRPIAAFQGVSFMLAEGRARLEAARVEAHDVACELDGGEEEISDRHERATTQAVNHATEVAAEVSRDAVQVLGGHGFICDHPVEQWYRATATLSTIDFDPSCGTFAPRL